MSTIAHYNGVATNKESNKVNIFCTSRDIVSSSKVPPNLDEQMKA